jgi:putative ABC transport system substrate-binding protein
MRRRTFVAAFCSVVTWPFAALGQQSSIRRIGMLLPFAEKDPEAQRRITAFREGLRELGWEEGRNNPFRL